MLSQIKSTLEKVILHRLIVGERPTIGELSKITGTPYSTLRRQLIKAEKSGYVEWELVDYKATGKRVFSVTNEGMSFIESYRRLF